MLLSIGKTRNMKITDMLGKNGKTKGLDIY